MSLISSIHSSTTLKNFIFIKASKTLLAFHQAGHARAQSARSALPTAPEPLLCPAAPPAVSPGSLSCPSRHLHHLQPPRTPSLSPGAGQPPTRATAIVLHSGTPPSRSPWPNPHAPARLLLMATYLGSSTNSQRPRRPRYRPLFAINGRPPPWLSREAMEPPRRTIKIPPPAPLDHGSHFLIPCTPHRSLK